MVLAMQNMNLRLVACGFRYVLVIPILVLSRLVWFNLVMFQFGLVQFYIICFVTIVQICYYAKSGACSFKNIGVIPILVLFGFCMVWFGYILVWFGMVLHHLAFDHCPDMLPYKIWSLQLQKYPSYANFSIIWFSIIWYSSASFGV